MTNTIIIINVEWREIKRIHFFTCLVTRTTIPNFNMDTILLSLMQII